MDTEQRLEALYERVNDVGFNPIHCITERILDTLPKTRRDVSTTFLNLSSEVCGNIFPYTLTEGTQQTYCCTQRRTQGSEHTGCNCTPINIGEYVLNAFPQRTSQFAPVVLADPFGYFVKRTDEELTNTLTDQCPVQICNCANYQIWDNGEPLDDQCAHIGGIPFLKTCVDQLSNMLADIIEINRVKEIIGSLDCSVDTEANLLADTAVVYAVNKFVDLCTNQCANGFPIGSVKRFPQTICKVTDLAVNGDFFKHRTVVGSTAATARTGVRGFLDDVQFINTSGVTLDLIRSFLCGTRSLIKRIAIACTDLLSRSVCTAARQTGNKHIDQIQQAYDLTTQIVDCRGKCVDDRCSHSTQTVLEVKGVRCNTVHADSELTAHQIAVLVKVIYTFL